jgi:phage terminase large subunit-like protein
MKPARRTTILPPELASLIADPARRDQILRDLDQRIRQRRIEMYEPYEKQATFHAAGAAHRERALLAGNQLGKSYSAAAELTYHLTGEYPPWWQGRRFTQPIAAWAAGMTNEVVRDVNQRLLIGRVEEQGTGMVPKAKIKNTTSSRGISGALDMAFIHHATGGISQLSFKSYEAGREKFQGETLDVLWFDEEPPYEIYSEGLTRTNASGGIVYATFTPLKGMTEVVALFYPRPTSPDRHLTQMVIEDAHHIPPARRASIVASYKPHEREARTRGVPMLGSGAIITVPESTWVVPAFSIPSVWPGVIGLDPGFEHPFGASLLRHDRDTDTVYVTHAIALQNQTIAQHATVLKPWGRYPVAWPHDAASHDRTSGDQIAHIYRKQGLEMLMEHATHEHGGYGIEASIGDMITRMEEGRFKVFDHLADLRQELRMWHRKSGAVVKLNDDTISAVRYGMMMLRFASMRRDGSDRATSMRRKMSLV